MIRILISILFFSFVLTVNSQRIISAINSGWTFHLENSPDKKEIVNIPHTWNNEDPFEGGREYFRGKGWYEKSLFLPSEWENKRIFLKFEGANQITKLWVNEAFAGQHTGGYTGFVFDITNFADFGTDNRIKIECDNSHNPDIPPLNADFNFYGGIYRDVFLIATNPVHFEINNAASGNILIRTPKVNEKEASIKIEGTARNSGPDSRNCNIQFKIVKPDGSTEAQQLMKIQLKPGASEKFVQKFTIQNPELWSPNSPQLYSLEISLTEASTGEKLDEYQSGFGCRWFEMDPEKGFFLNGKPLKLVGANRHQDFIGLGNALPNALHERDYRMMKDMGANFVRIAHYPHDPEAYRLCDELGLLSWSEIPVINDVTDSEAYHENCLKMQEEQILQFFNHPSVVIWGYMNEIFISMVFNRNMTEEARQAKIKTTLALTKKLDSITKALDPGRLTAMALHENEIYNSSGVADIPDVIGWNLYFGWYSPGLENLGKFLDEQHRRYPNRPLIISEYGPGSDIRIQTDTPKPWDYSEAYQLKSHKSYYRQIMERPYVAGMSAWNFADFGSSGRQDAMPYVNQKGLVNFNREPKDIYHYYQALLLEEPFVYIAGKNWEKRCVEENEKVTIRVFSNQNKVDLSVNDSTTFSGSTKQGIAEFEILLPQGKHNVTARAGSEVYRRSLEIFLRSNLLENIQHKAIAVNVGTHCDYTDPITKETWIADQEYHPGSWGYIGGEVMQKSRDKFQGTAINIQGTENDPLYQTMREGIEGYRFSVDKGKYRITLLFAEHNLRASEKLIYNLSEEEVGNTENLRAFSVKINGQKIIHNLNPARDYGRGRAIEISTLINTEKDITVEFEKIAGEPVLSGIKVERM